MATISGTKRPEYGWFDVYGTFKGMTTDEEKETEWMRLIEIARENTKRTMARVRKPKDKKEE